MNDFAVVIPTRYEAVIEPLLQSIEEFIPRPFPRIITVTHTHTKQLRPWCEVVPYLRDDFVFAKAINLGIEAAAGLDILALNDDTRLIEENFFYKLADRANAVPNFGIVSPKIKGCAGNPYQMVDGLWHYGASYVELRGRTTEAPTLAFVCVFLKRRMLDEIGLLDEGFAGGYGFEDGDACLRARCADWKTVIFKDPVIMHGDGSPGNARGRNWSLSYARNPEITSQLNYDYFLRKHGRQKVSS